MMAPRYPTPIAKKYPEEDRCESEAGCQVILQDYSRRLGQLEETIQDVLPTIGKVAQAMENISQQLSEIRENQRTIADKVDEVRGDIGEINVTISTYDNRIKNLEDARKTIDEDTKEKRKGFRTLVYSVVATVVGAALVYFLGFGSGKKNENNNQPLIQAAPTGQVEPKQEP
jgi:prefoldin subunit 5